jgi:hypothetical protein
LLACQGLFVEVFLFTCQDANNLVVANYGKAETHLAIGSLCDNSNHYLNHYFRVDQISSVYPMAKTGYFCTARLTRACAQSDEKLACAPHAGRRRINDGTILDAIPPQNVGNVPS